LVWRILQALPKPNFYDFCVLGMTVYLLHGARSATSNVLFISGALLCLGMQYLKTNPTRMKMVIIGLVLIGIILQLFITSFFGSSLSSALFSAAGRDETFTGRTALWSKLLPMGKRSPLVGVGYSSFWLENRTRMAELFEFAPNQAHNGYIELFLNLGLIGLILLFLVIFSTFKRLRANVGRNEPLNNLFFVFLLMIVLQNITEATIMIPTYFISLLFLLISLVVSTDGSASAVWEGNGH
jgi:exopolysaccharide production protein ExoQ